MNQTHTHIDSLLRQLPAEHRQQPKVRYDILGKFSISKQYKASEYNTLMIFFPLFSISFVLYLDSNLNHMFVAVLETYKSLTLKVGDFVNNDGSEQKLPLLTGTGRKSCLFIHVFSINLCTLIHLFTHNYLCIRNHSHCLSIRYV